MLQSCPAAKDNGPPGRGLREQEFPFRTGATVTEGVVDTHKDNGQGAAQTGSPLDERSALPAHCECRKGDYLVCAAFTAGLVGDVGAEIDAMLGSLTSKGDGSSSNFLYGSCRQQA